MGYMVAICDDDRSLCKDLNSNIYNVFCELGLSVNIKCFFSGEDLLCSLDDSIFDFIFLDIQLCKTSGLEIGFHIRDLMADHKTQIIFISSETKYASDLFQFHPLDFLVKPINFDQLKKTIITGLSIIDSVTECFDITVKNRRIRIPYNDIYYFESNGRKTRIYCKNDMIEYYGKLSNVIEILPDFFAQIHKSHIINMNNTFIYHYENVSIADGTVLAISRKFRNDIRNKLMKKGFK